MIQKFLLALLAVMITLTGCSNGVSQEKYDALLAENEQLKQQLAQSSSIPNNDSTSTDTIVSAGANLKVVEVEDVWYDFNNENHFTIYLKIRNRSGMSLGQVLPSIDIIDENGDIVASTAAAFMQVLDDGQGCTIDSDWVESTEAPYGIRISRMFIEDTDGNLEKIVINPAYVVKNIPSATSRQQDSKETVPTQSQATITESEWTQEEQELYDFVLLGYNEIYNSLKNPDSLRVYGIKQYDSETIVFKITATNGFGGTVTEYFAYNGALLSDAQVLYKGESVDWNEVVKYYQSYRENSD